MKRTDNLYKLIIVVAMLAFTVSCSSDLGGTGGGTSSESKGGSMARFCIVGDFLFTVDQNSLKTFDISDSKNPVFYDDRTQGLESGIETIFPMDSLLFIGSQNGMYIFRLLQRGFLQHLSTTAHIRSCDPVVAEGDYAYVTLNSNNIGCGRNSNLLQIYDITDIENPEFIKNVMGFSSPMGLGIDGNKLFVCDKGLKVFDIENRRLPRQIDDLHSAGLHNVSDAYDAIPLGKFLILVASSGIYQLDYTGESLRLLSKIEVKR
jgi:hypothetical protein